MRRQKNQRYTSPYTLDSHKNTELKAIIYTQWSQYRHVQAMYLLRVYISFAWLFQRPLFSFFLQDTLLLHLLLEFLSSERCDLINTYHLQLSVPRSVTFCIMSDCGSLILFSSLVGGSFSDDRLTLSCPCSHLHSHENTNIQTHK